MTSDQVKKWWSSLAIKLGEINRRTLQLRKWRLKEGEEVCEPGAGWNRGHSDKACGKGQCAECLLGLSPYRSDRSLGIPAPEVIAKSQGKVNLNLESAAIPLTV